MPHFLVLIVGEVGVKNFCEKITKFKQSRENGYWQFVENIPIVKEAVRVFVDQAKQFNEAPTCGQYLDEVEGVSDQRASDDVECEEYDQNLHFFHL